MHKNLLSDHRLNHRKCCIVQEHLIKISNDRLPFYRRITILLNAFLRHVQILMPFLYVNVKFSDLFHDFFLEKIQFIFRIHFQMLIFVDQRIFRNNSILIVYVNMLLCDSINMFLYVHGKR